MTDTRSNDLGSSQFTTDIRHKSGKDNIVADTLSVMEEPRTNWEHQSVKATYADCEKLLAVHYCHFKDLMLFLRILNKKCM
jgi:hypothetical protein